MEYYRESGMLDVIVHNLEQSKHIARIKKLVFCACTNNWSNEAQQLSTVKFTSYLQQLRDRHASTVELKYLLYRIVIRLNHSSHYYTVANLLCEEMEPLYSQDTSSNITLGVISSAIDAQSWGREVIFTVEEAQSGSVLQIKMDVLAGNRQLMIEATVILPNAAQLLAQYQEWQSRYRKLDPQNHRLISNKAVSLVPERINDCLDAGAMLQANLHQWYDSVGFHSIRDKLATALDPACEIDMIVRSRSKTLIRLPWNSLLQPLLDRYPHAEVSIALDPTIRHEAIEPEVMVSVLSILASAQGIKIDRSKEYLKALPHTTSEFIVAPTVTDFTNILAQKPWSVVLISSYISGYLPNNRIYLNHHDTISIAELKESLHTAIDKGLKVLILNCGDGIELAGELIDLQIPNLIVMREAVQDQVAQEFVKLLLKAFSGGKSLQLAVREARERLQSIEKVVPAASWLPVICQPIPDEASSWHQIAHIVPNTQNPDEIRKNRSVVEPTNIIEIDDPLVPTALSVSATIDYDKLTLVRQLTGYFSEVYAIALSQNGQWLVSGHGDVTHVDNTVKVWRMSDGKLIHNLLGHSDAIRGIALTTDAETIISGSLDGTLQWWQLTTGLMLPQLIEHPSPINALVLTSDNRKLITGGSDSLVRIWQPQDNLLIHQFQGHLQNIDCLATHQSTQLIVSGSSDYTIRLWHLQEGRLLRILLGHSSRVSGVAITPDGTKVVSASHDRTIKIWEAATGNLLNTLVGHSKPIGCVAISPDGRSIVSGSDDGTINIWNLSDGKLIRSISSHDRAILSIAISTDGRTIAAGGGEIQIWQIPE
jgi:WD domain, G-beta repeat